MKRLVVLLVILLAGVMTVSADTAIIDFNITTPTPGTISYAGGIAPLVGTDIEVDYVVGLGTPLNDSVQQFCDPSDHQGGCALNFTTGNLVSYDSGVWLFGAGGTITITGTLPGIPGVSNPLLSGTFTGVQRVDSTFQVVLEAFVDIKDPALAAYYGLPATGWHGRSNIGLNIVVDPGTNPPAFHSSPVLSGDVNNEIPEPGTLLLLGAGAILMAGFGRRWLVRS